MSGQTASNLLVACGVGGAIYTRTEKKKRLKTLHRTAATASRRTASEHIPRTIVAAATRRKKCSEENPKSHKKNQQDGYSPPDTSSRDNPPRYPSVAADTAKSV
jgi:hypothetical protein